MKKDQQTPNTPAVTLYWALQKAFDVMDAKGGTTQAVKRHHDASVHVRKRLVEMGFGLIAEKNLNRILLLDLFVILQNRLN